MLTLIRLRDPQTSQSVVINELTSSPTYPVAMFTWDYELAGDEIPKFEAPGQWDNFKPVRKMILNCEGHIVRQTTAAYWVARRALCNVVLPPANIPQVKRHTRIEMMLDGDSTTYYGEFMLDDYSIPMEANYPTVTPFQFQWTCNFGYWRNIATNAAVRL